MLFKPGLKNFRYFSGPQNGRGHFHYERIDGQSFKRYNLTEDTPYVLPAISSAGELMVDLCGKFQIKLSLIPEFQPF